jgi:3',5'-cyclic AMP phosphodiesterase CpdA
VLTRVLHLSDLHYGAGNDEAIEHGTPVLVERFEPELIVASGDLSHRGRADQIGRASDFLRSLGPPVLAVPGNHDLPYSFPARFTSPFRRFEREWETAEPTYSSDGLHTVGLNSVRPWRHQSGGIRNSQLARATKRLREGRPDAFRIVVLHHHLIGAPWRSHKKPVARRNHVLSSLGAAGADLILAGHTHQAAVSERKEFEIVRSGTRTVVVSIAPGLGQPRPRRHGEARGLHLYEIGEASLRVETFVWRDSEWALTAERVFPRDLVPAPEVVPTESARTPREPA